MRRLLVPLALLATSFGGAAVAQQGGVIACSSQDSLVEYLDTQGELVPSGCYTMEVAVLEHEGRQFCALDVTSAAEGFVGEAIGGALPTQWWTDCAAIGAQIP